MPGVEDWINNPLGIIQNIFDQHGTVDHELIPSLNSRPLHSLRPNSVVRYRCMIQDMYDPEFYLGVYEVNDVNTQTSKSSRNKHRINEECNHGPTDTLLYTSARGDNLDTAGQKAQPSTSHTPVRCKRSLDEDDVTEEAATKDVTMETNSSETSDNVKRTRTDESAESSAPVVPDLNFPLPSETGISCLVKIYDNLDGYQVNDVVEFIGVLSVDPALAQHSDNKPDGVQSSIEGYDEEPMEERNAHAPPPSLVPRLHAILANKLPHVNPYIPTNTEHTDFKTALNQLQSEVNTLRSQITSLLQHVVLGDTLAAEYLFCHLISTIYGRADVMPLGKFSVNLTQCPASKEFVDLLYKFISTLVTKSHLLPLTIDNMNTMKLNPQKDYTANRLKTGLLQLSSDTSLVVDETVLQPGQLDTNGVRNITSLGNLISWQKVEYDFSFHRQDFLSNSDCLIPLVPTTFPDSITEHFMKLDSTLTPELLNKIRPLYYDIP
ncbi:hypothetical protein KUTeg_012579 [Tegillarca granosa]|uniref:Mini-chromosome maintenance complex-binding protein n=1 Tax=Tegillarca granosa TaxID=220873 RepID=A0ABQ9EZZ1_TEGGR|nr:hypothetical protein KUTeg_012579 [Tegillarca granosa]